MIGNEEGLPSSSLSFPVSMVAPQSCKTIDLGPGHVRSLPCLDLWKDLFLFAKKELIHEAYLVILSSPSFEGRCLQSTAKAEAHIPGLGDVLDLQKICCLLQNCFAVGLTAGYT